MESTQKRMGMPKIKFRIFLDHEVPIDEGLIISSIISLGIYRRGWELMRALYEIM